MRDARINPAVAHLGLLLVCALIASRPPVAQPPLLRASYLDAATTSITREASGCEGPAFEISKPTDLTAMSKARVYADVNVVRPKEYWDYESLTVQWG